MLGWEQGGGEGGPAERTGEFTALVAHGLEIGFEQLARVVRLLCMCAREK